MIKIKSFEELSTSELYQILKLRVDVFIVEQACAYADLDDLDQGKDVVHIIIYQNDDDNAQLLAYARCLPPEMVFNDSAAIGRVLVAQKGRGKGFANKLMLAAIQQCQLHWPDKTIKISAQTYLNDFYKGLGFTVISEPYLEDGIEHQEMELVAI